MKSKLIIILITFSLLFGGLIASARVAQDPVAEDPVAQDQEAETAEQIKANARKLFMRGKLVSNQRVVEGLSVKNFDMIRQGAESVTALVKGQHWFVLNTPEYREYSNDLEDAAGRLRDAANDKNIEAATLRYFDMTLKCIDCHRYLETLGH